MKKLFLVFSILTASITVMGQQPIPVKPRILISTHRSGRQSINGTLPYVQ